MRRHTNLVSQTALASIVILALLLTVILSAQSTLVIGSTSAVSSTSEEVDWWSMFQHDPAHAGHSTTSAPNTCERRFTVNYTSSHNGYESPVVVDGRVIISGGWPYSLYSLNSTSGRFLWASEEYFYTDATPAVSNNRIVIQSDGTLYCFHIDNGTMIWKYNYGKGGYGNLASPIIHDGVIFFSSGTTSVIEPRGNVFALSLMEMENATSPKLIWKTLIESIRTSTPAYSDGRILLSYNTDNEEYVACLNATYGTEIWRQPRFYPTYASAPTVVDGKVYFGSVTGNVLCLEELSGELLWLTPLVTEVRQQHVYGSPAVANGRVFVGTLAEVVVRAKFFSLNASSGGILWEYQANRTGEPFNSSPAVADGKVFASSTRRIYAFNETDGSLIWSFQTNHNAGAPAIASGSVYVTDSGGYVYCFNFKLYFSIKANPVFYDNFGQPLVPTPSSWTILFPNGTRKTAKSAENYYSPMGTYSIVSVIWKEHEVLRSGQVSTLLDSNMTWMPRINCTLPTRLSLSLSSSTSLIGFKVGINGDLTCNEIGVQDAAILLSYSVTGGQSWNDISQVETTSNGRYSVVWTPQATGSYIVKTAWAGNSTFPSSTATINLAVSPCDDQAVFTVESNSTISGLSFDTTSRRLSFTVSGANVTRGYTRVTIAKALLTDITKLKIHIDSVEYSYTVAETDDAWILAFTYEHSVHSVVISLGQIAWYETLPVQAVALAILAAVVAFTATYLALKRKKSRDKQ